MNNVVCSICGCELDGDNANICLSCGRVICPKELDSDSGFCRDCTEMGPYTGC